MEEEEEEEGDKLRLFAKELIKQNFEKIQNAPGLKEQEAEREGEEQQRRRKRKRRRGNKNQARMQTEQWSLSWKETTLSG